jgi:hypothetical protein
MRIGPYIRDMRIGICTLHWSDNYGAVLQAYALQMHLAGLGHDVRVLDIRPQTQLPSLKPWLSYTLRGMQLKSRARHRHGFFEAFRKQHLRLSPRPLRSSKTLQAEAENYDALISGSDQVWNPRWQMQYPWFPMAYLLECAPAHARKIAYAASFGFTTCENLPPAWTRRFRAAVTAFDAISVRERSGTAIVRELTGRNDASFVADPTLLIDADALNALAGPPCADQPYIFTNMLHGLAEQADAWLTDDLWPSNMPRLRCDKPDRWPVHAGSVLSPQEWLGAIRHAACVITNSFHAVKMCLRFHTPFIALPLEGELAPMNVRLHDILAEFRLTDRIAPNPTTPDRSLTEARWDWESIDAATANLRSRAASFLRESGL